MRKLAILGIVYLISAVLNLNAKAMEISKPVAIALPVQSKQHPQIMAFNKIVYLMGIQLTAKERAALFKFRKQLAATTLKSSDETLKLASAVNLGMNGVPVLDQGLHGTCVIFALTAAFDAAIGKGDYISQLCQLELGATLEKNSYMPSGWEGSSGAWVMEQMFRFGIVNKSNQYQKSCAGIKEYPTNNNANQGNPMSEEDYKSMSESLLDQGLHPVYQLSQEERFSDHFSHEDNIDQLRKVKQALSRGDRIAIGTILFKLPGCMVGACAKHEVNNDTWVITKAFDDTVEILGGHEMVIYGYDDHAVAIDADGKQYRGLFRLRNSWGDDAGDHGDFYMSYDYFMTAVDEIHIVARNTAD